MKKESVTRWLEKDRPPGDSLEARFVEKLRRVEVPAALDAEGRARVWSSLKSPRARVRGAPTLRWAIVGAALLTSGGVVAAVGLARGTWPAFRRPATVAPPASAPPASSRKIGLRVASPPTPAQEALPAPEPRLAAPALAPDPTVAPPAEAPRAPTPTVAAVSAHPRRAAPVSLEPEPMVAPPPAAASALAEETAALSAAMTKLRQARDGEASLAALDAYRARFPRGILRREADEARVDAHLLLGQQDEALRTLEGLALGAGGRGQELRVIRGELRAAHDCAAAARDFDILLGSGTPTSPDLIERALYGRAMCRARQGDGAGARRDLDLYLDRFPRGRFAPEARHARDGL